MINKRTAKLFIFLICAISIPTTVFFVYVLSATTELQQYASQNFVRNPYYTVHNYPSSTENEAYYEKEGEKEEGEEDVFEPPIHILEEFFSQFPHMAVYYHNIERDFTFAHNGDRVYFAASLTKAPFAMYIYQKADQGHTDLNSKHPFLQKYYAGGSGVIRHNFEIGQYLTQNQLLAYNIFHSDNVALRMLRSIHGLDGFTEFVADLGGDPTLIHNITYSRTTSNQAGILTRAMYDYIESGSPYSRVFLDHLLNNHHSFISSGYPVAGKTGWFDSFGGAWHEMAIVYAPSPFVLVILSDRYGGVDNPNFQQIIAFLERFNRQYM